MKRRQFLGLLALGIPAAALGHMSSTHVPAAIGDRARPSDHLAMMVSWTTYTGQLSRRSLGPFLQPVRGPYAFVHRRNGWSVRASGGSRLLRVVGELPAFLTVERLFDTRWGEMWRTEWTHTRLRV